MKVLKVRETQCATCPFIEGSKYEFLKEELSESALTHASRICHSTGSNNAINRRTGKRPLICRGARNLQIAFWHSIGFIEAPTDEAWAKKLREIRKEE